MTFEKKLKEERLHFRDEEISRLKSLTSLNFVKFSLNAKEYLPEKILLYKACRIYEDELLDILNKNSQTEEEKLERFEQLHSVYMELGHINLLAHDFARALSAYQKSFNANSDTFWHDSSGLYGIAVSYLHFRLYRPAIELFCQLLFCHPYSEIVTEVHARLGIAFKCLENFSQSLKHLVIALDDTKELQLIPKYQIRFHIAHCYDGAKDFKRATEEYRRLLFDHERLEFQLPVLLLAVVYRQLGWVSLRQREKEFKEEVRNQKLKEAEQHLLRARELAPTDSKTNCYLGLCYSEQTTIVSTPTPVATSTSPHLSTLHSGFLNNSTNNNNNIKSSGSVVESTNRTPVKQDQDSPTTQVSIQQKRTAADRAQDAFVSYRSAIDSDESDANTWCSIGVLYQQQKQPIDALQAFACAVQLDDKHSAAWTELGRLYETYRQYNESLHCYRKALQNNSEFAETLRSRVSILEKEFNTPAATTALINHLQAASNRHLNTRIQILPSLESAWQLGIPAQVRQRLSDLYKQQQNRYREGSPLWNMSELAAHALRQAFYELDSTQRQIMQVLKMNKDCLENNDLYLLKKLEERYCTIFTNNNNGSFNFNNDVSSNKSEDKTSSNDEQTYNNPTASIAKKNNNTLKIKLNDDNKIKMSKNAVSDITGLPCISEDDLAIVLGDDFTMKTEENSDDSLLSMALDERVARSEQIAAEPSTSFLSSKSPRLETEEKNCDFRKRRLAEKCNTTSSSPSEKILRHENDIIKLSDSLIKESFAVKLQKDRISDAKRMCNSLPPAFSLLASVYVPVTVSSAEILEICKKRRMKSDDYKPIFDEYFPPPKPPVIPKKKLNKEQLLLKTPLIVVENSREAFTTELQNFCYNSSIALVHGLTAALKIDLSQFSTKSLIQIASDHEVEVRSQYKMPNDFNFDHLNIPTWNYYSSKSFTTISRYGQYQAESFRHSLKEETQKLKLAVSTPATFSAPAKHQLTDESPTINQSVSSTNGFTASMQSGGNINSKRRKVNGNVDQEGNDNSYLPLKIIKFGTNVDLSDERKFAAQLKELNKMPAFCRISAACNLLTHLGHTVLGMNTVQLYMKVPGCRTPGHLENNSFASININIGPGECEWFAVPYEYWPVIERMCKERGLDFLKGVWWPNMQDLLDADVPCYRFTQKAGDVVWVGGGCVHWVQATGWCNNVAWNVGPMTANQLEMALQAHEWNRLNTYRSLVPLQHLAWQLARDVRFSNQKVFNVVKNILIRSFAYCIMIADFVELTAKSPIKMQLRQKGEAAHYCHLCEIEVFNILFVKEVSSKFRVFCVQCARKNNIDDYVVLQQIPFDELSNIFDRFQLHPAKSALIC